MTDNEWMPDFVKARGKNWHNAECKYKKLTWAYLRHTIVILVLCLYCLPAHATVLSFSWNSSSGATGYKVHYGFESRDYIFIVDIGNWTQCTVSDLDPGQNYYFAVTAYNDFGESGLSQELSYTPEMCAADIDIDGDIDGSDIADIISGSSGITLGEFAARFGAESCDN